MGANTRAESTEHRSKSRGLSYLQLHQGSKDVLVVESILILHHNRLRLIIHTYEG
jgi:hypothetical protein